MIKILQTWIKISVQTIDLNTPMKFMGDICYWSHFPDHPQCSLSKATAVTLAQQVWLTVTASITVIQAQAFFLFFLFVCWFFFSSPSPNICLFIYFVFLKCVREWSERRIKEYSRLFSHKEGCQKSTFQRTCKEIRF